MALNQSYFEVSTNPLGNPTKYMYKQPTELKNPHQLALMSYNEKEMYAIKLQTEIQEHERREVKYTKRR